MKRLSQNDSFVNFSCLQEDSPWTKFWFFYWPISCQILLVDACQKCSNEVLTFQGVTERREGGLRWPRFRVIVAETRVSTRERHCGEQHQRRETPARGRHSRQDLAQIRFRKILWLNLQKKNWKKIMWLSGALHRQRKHTMGNTLDERMSTSLKHIKFDPELNLWVFVAFCSCFFIGQNSPWSVLLHLKSVKMLSNIIWAVWRLYFEDFLWTSGTLYIYVHQKSKIFQFVQNSANTEEHQLGWTCFLYVSSTSLKYVKFDPGRNPLEKVVTKQSGGYTVIPTKFGHFPSSFRFLWIVLNYNCQKGMSFVHHRDRKRCWSLVWTARGSNQAH